MFKFFKDKIKGAISKLSRKVEDEAEDVRVEEITKEDVIPEKKEVLEKPIEKTEIRVEKKIDEHKAEVKMDVISEPERTEEKYIPKPEVKKETPKVEPIKYSNKEEEKKSIEEKPKKKGFFTKLTEKITTKKIDAKLFQNLFWDLELALLENNVAMEVIEKIKADLKTELVDKPVPRSKIQKTIENTLQKSIRELFMLPELDLLKLVEKKKPLVICFIGINGSGKTTTIAKIANLFLKNNKTVVLAASDTFRAAAIDQLQIHADKLGVKMIRHDYGADAAAVAFDAIKHAESKNKDVVLIDTAGRLHSNHNLVAEMKKIVRIAKPDITIFVGESITGNDCTEQAMKFDEAVGIDGIILSKADIDEKGGTAISISYVTKKPILYLGMGQEYDDLVKFDSEVMMKQMFG